MTDAPDPTATARAWLAANPDHEVAVHVREALASADRYEMLAREMETATGTRVVIATLTERGPVLTSPRRKTEREIAHFLGDYLCLVETVRLDMRAAEARAVARAARAAQKRLAARHRDGA